jgi:hypothetical protein
MRHSLIKGGTSARLTSLLGAAVAARAGAEVYGVAPPPPTTPIRTTTNTHRHHPLPPTTEGPISGGYDLDRDLFAAPFPLL